MNATGSPVKLNSPNAMNATTAMTSGGLQDAAEDEGEHERASGRARADRARRAPIMPKRPLPVNARWPDGAVGTPRAQWAIGRPERPNHEGHEDKFNGERL